MARLYRDAYGVPHLRASSVTDLARAQGRVTALDRSWQLEHQRRRATGTTAEVLGPAGLAWDRLARRTRIAHTARRAYDALGAETRAFVDAYVVGVNEGLHGGGPELAALGITPQPWEGTTPLAVFLGQHLLFASLPGKLWEHRARSVLGPDAGLLSHEGPLASGSNAWAVGGARTASGSPLIGGDPHRAIESPGVYQQVRLACEDPADAFDVVGLTFPGVPGVQHFAHAGEVAWAITNAMGDYQDAYAEELRRVAPGAGVRAGVEARVEARGPGGWEPCTAHVESIGVWGAPSEEVEVVETPRGPVFEGGPDDRRGLSVRAASTVLGDLGFDSLLPLLRARCVDDVEAALATWVEPVNNVVVADRAGTLRYLVAGRVPTRAEGNRHGIVEASDPGTAWTGWVDPLPRSEVAPDGQVVTANERRGPESHAIGVSFAPPFRADRLQALLSGRSGLVASDFAALHNDTLLATVPLLQGLLRGLRDEACVGSPVRDAILAWDGHLDADSAGAAAFAAWRSALVRRLAAQPVLAPLHEPTGHSSVFGPWLGVTGRVALALESLVRAGSPYGLDLAALAAQALDDAHPPPATWGQTHVFAPVHAFDLTPVDGLVPPAVPAVPLSGDTDCVRCCGSVPGVSDACQRGSVARYVWDLADRSRSGWVVPLGAAADPTSPHHHDQLPLWAAGDLVPVVTDWDLLIEETL